MTSKLSKGDRVAVSNEQVAARLDSASRVGVVVQSDPDDPAGGTYQIMLDGEELPQWVRGTSLTKLSK